MRISDWSSDVCSSDLQQDLWWTKLAFAAEAEYVGCHSPHFCFVDHFAARNGDQLVLQQSQHALAGRSGRCVVAGPTAIHYVVFSRNYLLLLLLYEIGRAHV